MAKDKADKKTKEIPGTGCTVEPEITKKGEELKKVRGERMKLTKQEVKLVGELAALMKAKKIKDYVDPDGCGGNGLECHLLVTHERVKVAALTAEDEQPEVETT